MADCIVDMGNGFWNVRGSFKVFGMLDVGTQCSLVRRKQGDFVLLDSYTLTGPVLEQVLELTDGGNAISAIINLHPFHTVHVHAVHEQFPEAKLYGTSRHVAKAPDLAWQPELTDSAAFQALFADDFEFTVPPGVDFIPDNENLHFASVLAFHPDSKSLHVDDTLTFTKLPLVGGLSFHMTLKQVLKKEPGAVATFRNWAEQLAERCSDVEHLATAHMRALPTQPPEFGQAVRQALQKVEKVLQAHEARWG